MKLKRYHVKRSAAALIAGSALGAVGIGGVVAAQADPGPATTPGTSQVVSDGDGEQDDASEVESDGETDDDATDQGPDADPDEPGHQDASDS